MQNQHQKGKTEHQKGTAAVAIWLTVKTPVQGNLLRQAIPQDQACDDGEKRYGNGGDVCKTLGITHGCFLLSKWRSTTGPPPIHLH